MNVEKLLMTLSLAFNKMQTTPKKHDGIQVAIVSLGLCNIFGLLALFSLAFTWVIGNWQSNDAVNFSGINFGLGILIIAFFMVGGLVTLIQRVRRGPHFVAQPPIAQVNGQAQEALITAMHVPDDAILPPLDYTPPSVSVPQQRERLVVLAGLKTFPKETNYWSLLGGWSYLLFWFLLQLQSVIVDIVRSRAQNADAYTVASDLGSTLRFILVGLLLSLGTYALIDQFIFAGRRIFVDAVGLSWRHFGRWVSLPWSDIQCIGAYIYGAVNQYQGARAGRKILPYR